MLLLVLILVVIAFGLLVVALLSGSVLWAWVSVGVSVLAAVVLLVDWLQRRAAVKVGAAPAVEPAAGTPAPLANMPTGGPPPSVRRPPVADMDPATEVLPVVPSSPRGGDETVVMPAVRPSGSPTRPSGAEPAVTSSSANSSPTVTAGAGEPSDPGFGAGDMTAAVVPAAAARFVASRGADAAAENDPAAENDAAAVKGPSLRKGAGVDAAEKGAAEKGAAETEDVAAEPPGSDAPDAPGTVVPAGGPAEPTASNGAPAVDAAGSDAESTVQVEAHTRNPAEPAAPAAAAEQVGLFGSTAVRQPAEQAPADRAPAEQSPAEPAAAVEEAPEEPRDAVAAEIVSRLDDEVVVIDEQPRYHVTGCRALVAVAVIPLPVREAVELGFTPCGWCSPDRTLAGRHQTASR